jgi:glyoxylase-like metal-dependent hydrolase (beta-lactamase superfamily II)
MNKKWKFAAVAAALLAGAASSALAGSPAGMKLYAFSSGALTIGKGVLQNFAPMDPPIQIPVGFFVIKHPKGNVLFDTGNNDKIIDDLNYWPKAMHGLNPVRTPDVAIDAQLRKIGMTPDDIKYVVVSHMHLDHGGNVGKFPNATLIIERDEINFAFFPDEPYAGPFIPNDVYVLRSPAGSNNPNSMKMVILDHQDYDIFGDGSIVVKSFRGHTKGSQMMDVRLPKRGLTILTGDNVYFRENVDKHIPPNLVLAYDPNGVMKAYDYLRLMMATQGADYFTAHDPDAFKAMKHAPEYYE